jgi:hypothetical protein
MMPISLPEDFGPRAAPADLLGGDVWLASGAELLHRRTVAGGQRANVLRAVVPWPGSWVCLDAPLG